MADIFISSPMVGDMVYTSFQLSLLGENSTSIIHCSNEHYVKKVVMIAFEE